MYFILKVQPVSKYENVSFILTAALSANLWVPASVKIGNTSACLGLKWGLALGLGRVRVWALFILNDVLVEVAVCLPLVYVSA